LSKLIPASERIIQARALIQKARDLTIPEEFGRGNLTYIAAVRDLLRQARDLVKFIPQTAGVSAEKKHEVQKIYEEIEETDEALLSRPSQTRDEKSDVI
jgi:hypothetical protein